MTDTHLIIAELEKWAVVSNDGNLRGVALRAAEALKANLAPTDRLEQQIEPVKQVIVPATVTEAQADCLGIPPSLYARVIAHASQWAGTIYSATPAPSYPTAGMEIGPLVAAQLKGAAEKRLKGAAENAVDSPSQYSELAWIDEFIRVYLADKDTTHVADFLRSKCQPPSDAMTDRHFVALATISAMTGNVDHSKGGGSHAAKMYGEMLMDIRACADAALTQGKPDA
jgi:hypothetical protein